MSLSNINGSIYDGTYINNQIDASIITSDSMFENVSEVSLELPFHNLITERTFHYNLNMQEVSTFHI